MSADNGVYILRTRDTHKQEVSNDIETRYGASVTFVRQEGGIDAWRVAHAQGIDNLEWFEKNQPYNVGYYLHRVWGHSEVFYNEREAVEFAFEELKRIGYTEYGVASIDRPQYVFPD